MGGLVQEGGIGSLQWVRGWVGGGNVGGGMSGKGGEGTWEGGG